VGFVYGVRTVFLELRMVPRYAAKPLLGMKRRSRIVPRYDLASPGLLGMIGKIEEYGTGFGSGLPIGFVC
jgi:hypothetical protein